MKILIADDHPIVRRGLQHFLSHSLEDAQFLEAGDHKSAAEILAENEGIDLLFLDLAMPGMNGFEGFVALREMWPNLPIIIFTMNEDRRNVLKAIDLGAMAYVTKSSPIGVILRAIEIVRAGGVFMPAELMSTSASQAQGNLASDFDEFEGATLRIDSLTRRQLDVLELLRFGWMNAEIANQLGASQNTVRLHTSAILNKLGFSNRTQAALFAAKYFSDDEKRFD